MKYLVRVVVKGTEMHLIEWSAANELPHTEVVRQVAYGWRPEEHGYDVTFEVRADGEPWDGKRYRVQPVLQVLSA